MAEVLPLVIVRILQVSPEYLSWMNYIHSIVFEENIDQFALINIMVYIGKNLQLIIDYRDMSPSTILIIYYSHILSFFTLKPQLEITIDLVLEPATLDLKT